MVGTVQSNHQIGALQDLETDHEAGDGRETPLQEVVVESPEQQQAGYEARLKEMRNKSNELRDQAKTMGILTDDADTHDFIKDLKMDTFSPFYKALNESDIPDNDLLTSTSARNHRLDKLDDQINDPNNLTIRSDLLREKEALLVVQAYMDGCLMRKVIANRVNKILNEFQLQRQQQESGNVKVAKELKANRDVLSKTLGPVIRLSAISRIYFETIVTEQLKEFENSHGDSASNLLEHLNDRLGIQIDRELEQFEVVESNAPKHHTLPSVISELQLTNLDSDLDSIKKWINKLSDDVLSEPEQDSGVIIPDKPTGSGDGEVTAA